MIALVAGDVAVRRPDHVVIETAGGVGYRLAVSAETLRQVPGVGRRVSLHAHLVVRDDALALYGFATEEERELFLAPVQAEAEEDLERSLRPRRLADFVGQERVKEQLAIALEAAKGRGDALDHVLLAGPPGLGKTSLAYIVREALKRAA